MSPTSYRTAPPRAKVQFTPNLPPSPQFEISQFEIPSLVGVGRFELPTSRLSGVRSNQLSYRPMLLSVNFCRKKEPHFTSVRVRCNGGRAKKGRVASVANKLPAIYLLSNYERAGTLTDSISEN